MQRRRFLEYMGLAGLAISPLIACSSRTVPINKPGPQVDSKQSWTPFVQIEASGEPFEIGKVLGTKTRDLILAVLDDRRVWFEDLKQFALADRKTRIDGFKKAVESHHPEILAELQGLAKGAGLPFDDIFILNIQTELGALKRQIDGDACSTFQLNTKSQKLLVHNEDGNEANHKRMIIFKASPNGAPRFVSLLYPGVIGGSVPFMNDAGLLMSTNFIGAKEVKIGVPRYVLGRAVLYKKTIDEAIKVATNKDRAYSFHLNLGSSVEKRLVALDISPSKYSLQQTDGLFLQTNHFVLPGTKDIVQTAYKPGGSSDSRYQILSKGMKSLPPLEEIVEKHLVELLSSHEATMQPYSPCRHPTEDVLSRTLATAVFDLNNGTFHLYEGNPCEKRLRKIEVA